MGLIVPKGEAKKKETLVHGEKVARKELPKLMGYTPEKVAQMTMEEVVLRWFITKHLNLDGRFNAYMVLPPREALPQLLKLNQDSHEFFK